MKTFTLIISILTCVFLYSCKKKSCNKIRKEYSNSDIFQYTNYIDHSNWLMKNTNGSDTINVVYSIRRPSTFSFPKDCSMLFHEYILSLNNDNKVIQHINFMNKVVYDNKSRISFKQSIYDSITVMDYEFEEESFFDVNITTPSNDYISLYFIKDYNYMNITLDNVAVFTFNIGEQHELYVYKLYYSKSGPVKLQLSDSTVYEVIESDFTKVDIDYFR